MKISKQNFQAYLKVQRSGVTNMFDVAVVSKLSELSKEIIIQIMQNYSELKKIHQK